MINAKKLKEFEAYKHAETLDKLLYRPSASEQWMNCPASVRLSEGIELPKKAYSEEGRFAHEVCEALYYEEFFGLPVVRDKFQKDYPEFMVNYDEIESYAKGYIDVIKELLDGVKKGDIPVGKILYQGIEKELMIHEGTHGISRGTADFILIGDKGALILDFKYGKGVRVHADTTQIKTYFVGLLPLIESEDYKMISVVYQPRMADTYDIHTYTKRQIRGQEAAVAIILNSRHLMATPGNHCFWCKASRTLDQDKKCKAKSDSERDKLFDSLSSFIPDMEKKSRTEMVKDFLAIFPSLKSLYVQLQEEFKARIEGGEKVEGMRVETKKGRRGWIKKPKEQVKAEFAASYPGVDLFEMIEKQRTITAVEKQLKAKLSGDFVQHSENITLVVDGEAELDVQSMYDNLTND